MADTDPNAVLGTSGQPTLAPRRTHTYSRLTTALAVLALATAAYVLWRLDATGERLDAVAEASRAHEAERSLLRIELQNLEQREQQRIRELDLRLDALDEVPRQIQELANSTEELRGRAQGPERAWSRAEAMYLLGVAQRRLALDRDVETAIIALQAADTRLAALRDASFSTVRREIALELQALRSVRRPDTTGILASLAGLEDRSLQLPVKGIVATEPRSSMNAELPEGFLSRARAILRNAVTRIIVVRDVDDSAGVISKEAALLRRQHLQLMLFSARLAVARHDDEAYRNAIAKARLWLAESFDLSDPAAQAALKELQALEPIQIAPPLPDISASSAALRKLMPGDPVDTRVER
jgi:uroporphyrin-III C-methyltransferase